MKILVTGAAGFVGMHTAARLLQEGHSVVGVDNLNSYYSLDLKRARLKELAAHKRWEFVLGDISDPQLWSQLEAQHPDIAQTIHLAAQAGVRYSLENPRAYAQTNMMGFLEVLEYAKRTQQRHVVYASSSSVYGTNDHWPYRVTDPVDHPVSMYAATKKANELMAHTYTHLYGLPTSGLRFFTVYGPWGRPDMAYWLFTQAILESKPIRVFNQGDMYRDFTYIDDIVSGILKVLDRSSLGTTPYKLYNIGNNRPEKLLDMIQILEDLLEKKAEKQFLPLQPGDVLKTQADIQELEQEFGWHPTTTLQEGLERFIRWYRAYQPPKGLH